MELKERIQELAEKYYPEIVKIRRHIHQHPELSNQEFETAKFIESHLKKLNIKYKTGIANTGIVAFIEGKNQSKKVVALRADIDALPIDEKNDFPFKSQNKGVMHACGHDAHTAMLIGVIYILNELKDLFEGTIKFIFQPSEEKLPGGAKKMIEEGVLENPAPEFIIAQHVYPELNTGKIGFKPGIYMASTDELYFTVKGKGGHGAMPEKITNTVLIAAKIITHLQDIPKQAPAGTPTVLSIGKVIANGATNVIPDEVYMEGTFRTMNEEWRSAAHLKIEKIATEIAESMGAKIDIEVRKGYPVLVNDELKTEQIMNFARDFAGNDNIENLDLRMTSEDFAYYSQKIPATFYRLGVTKKDEKYTPLHSSNFNIDEEALKQGIGLMSYITINYLKNQWC